MAELIAGAVVLPLAAALYVLGRSRYGTLCLSEVPGFLWVILAGRSHRHAAAAILQSRSRAASGQM